MTTETLAIIMSVGFCFILLALFFTASSETNVRDTLNNIENGIKKIEKRNDRITDRYAVHDESLYLEFNELLNKIKELDKKLCCCIRRKNNPCCGKIGKDINDLEEKIISVQQSFHLWIQIKRYKV